MDAAVAEFACEASQCCEHPAREAASGQPQAHQRTVVGAVRPERAGAAVGAAAGCPEGVGVVDHRHIVAQADPAARRGRLRSQSPW